MNARACGSPRDPRGPAARSGLPTSGFASAASILERYGAHALPRGREQWASTGTPRVGPRASGEKALQGAARCAPALRLPAA